MTESAPERTCPNCGKTEVESSGVVAAYYPRQTPDLADRGKRIVERKLRCQACGHVFAEVEEHEF